MTTTTITLSERTGRLLTDDCITLKHIFLSPVWHTDMEVVAYWMIFTYNYGYLGRTRNIKDFI
jgi:hypothetical protein